MDFFMGVAHPLSYTDDGDVAPEDGRVTKARVELMREAGAEWVTCDMPFPFEGRMGRVSGAFSSFLELVSAWSEAGFKVMAVTPYPAGFEGGWKMEAGRPGSSRFLRTYEEACRFLAREFGGSVSGWQIANQLNLERFRRPLSEEGAVEFLRAGATGVRSGNPQAFVGVNMFGFGPTALRMYAKLYLEGEAALDYVGANGFFGTFEPGGPESWYEKVALLNQATGRPVIVQEFGYPSRGEVMTPAERASGKTHHELRKLPFAWPSAPLGEHTPQSQAAYLEKTFWVLRNSPGVLGAIWFSWSDRAKCWNCGARACPAGTAHGLVDVDGTPKPSYHAFRRAAEGHLDVAALYPDRGAFSESDPAGTRLELARRIAENEALRARADVLERMLRGRERALGRLRGSLLFRTYSFLTRPLARLAQRLRGLASRRRGARSPVDRVNPDDA